MELENTNKSSFTGKPPLRFKDWDVNSLVDYIVGIHHDYLRKTLPEVSRCLEKVVTGNGKLHPELISINRLLNEVNLELMSHLEEEELIVFPFIKKYYSAKNPIQEISQEELGKIQAIISRMENEHDVFGRKMDMIRVVSGNYILPPGASKSYAHLFKLLKEFENDFFIHLHLENHILFPKVSALEIK